MNELCVGIGFYRTLDHIVFYSSWLHHVRYIQVAGLVLYETPLPRLPVIDSPLVRCQDEGSGRKCTRGPREAKEAKETNRIAHEEVTKSGTFAR